MIASKKPESGSFDDMAERFGIRNITARLMANRGVTNDEAAEAFLNGGKEMMRDPSTLADIKKGAELMLQEIEKGSKIRVIGDYDVDGICSSFILIKGLGLFGADADYVLPDRVKDGYGLSIKLVDQAISDGRDMIITCDNGIAAFDQVAHAREKGIKVIVTDHHEVPFEKSEDGDVQDIDEENKKELLPPADAVIDPKRKDGDCSFKEICGAVVAYKFLQVMAVISGRDKEDAIQKFFDDMLVFAGIATVCDVMELKDENRIIVRESLKRIADTDNVGLRALINVTELDPHQISAFHYGFVIGPCLNASGRLDLASRALELFLEEDFSEAVIKAGTLKDMNESRKTLTRQGTDMAMSIIEERIEKTGLPKVIVVYLKDGEESIVGIIAGRIKERYYRPTIVVTDAADGGVKGSGRSIEGYDMFKGLSECRELFSKFGGHKMAAGLSLPLENLEELDRRLNENCSLSDEDFEPVIHLDMELPFAYADMDLVREFKKLEPFGNGNSKPLFGLRKVRLYSGRVLGKNNNCGKYSVSDDGSRKYDMMYFGDMDKWHGFLSEKYGEKALEDLYAGRGNGEIVVTIAYYPDINSYMGKENLQMIMSDYK